jgi:hypothetical protein
VQEGTERGPSDQSEAENAYLSHTAQIIAHDGKVLEHLKLGHGVLPGAGKGAQSG